MSFQGDCPGCTAGNHDHHNAGHGTREGLIGGVYCGCTGDCADRRDSLMQEFADFLTAPTHDRAVEREEETAR